MPMGQNSLLTQIYILSNTTKLTILVTYSLLKLTDSYNTQSSCKNMPYSTIQLNLSQFNEIIFSC